jgi:hypothetical protein
MESIEPELANFFYVNLNSCSDSIQCMPNKDCMRAVH